MNLLMFVCLILSFSLAVSAMTVRQLRRQRVGLEAIIQRLVNQEFYRADETDRCDDRDT
ncbi:hypothetical protein [Rubripirellula amarantea]|uniref:hypothetical protein n=1 Tax=Rubripirellula amarantea TaxID=2527999 RepID=UPI0013EEEA5B|nr:hypothetical protein [Rubripirellula amarantea]